MNKILESGKCKLKRKDNPEFVKFNLFTEYDYVYLDNGVGYFYKIKNNDVWKTASINEFHTNFVKIGVEKEQKQISSIDYGYNGEKFDTIFNLMVDTNKLKKGNNLSVSELKDCLVDLAYMVKEYL